MTREDLGGDARGRSGAAGLLGFVYGAAEVDELPGPAVVRLLGDCGMSASATRSLLARLRRSGDLHASTTGRTTTYRLAGAMRAAWERGDRAGRGVPGPADWDGILHGALWSVPETQRGFRDALRRLARLAGYGTLHPGLAVCVDDRWGLVEAQLGDVPDGAWVAPVELRLPPDDAAAALRQAWDLDALAATYRDLASRLRAVDSVAEPSPEALRQYARVTRPVYDALVRDPGLPPRLLPADWPMGELLEALHRVTEQVGPAAWAHIDAVLDRG